MPTNVTIMPTVPRPSNPLNVAGPSNIPVSAHSRSQPIGRNPNAPSVPGPIPPVRPSNVPPANIPPAASSSNDPFILVHPPPPPITPARGGPVPPPREFQFHVETQADVHQRLAHTPSHAHRQRAVPNYTPSQWSRQQNQRRANALLFSPAHPRARARVPAGQSRSNSPTPAGRATGRSVFVTAGTSNLDEPEEDIQDTDQDSPSPQRSRPPSHERAGPLHGRPRRRPATRKKRKSPPSDTWSFIRIDQQTHRKYCMFCEYVESLNICPCLFILFQERTLGQRETPRNVIWEGYWPYEY
jgi:hypothetical protein